MITGKKGIKIGLMLLKINPNILNLFDHHQRRLNKICDLPGTSFSV